ncbi:MAG: VOC family protein [Chloroflexi bacterium]|nr:VOC family protein [Chloroflexota bacterium]
MFAGVDRVVVQVRDMQRGLRAYADLGFALDSDMACTATDCLQLARGDPEGLHTIVIETDDLAAEVAAMRTRGVDVSESAAHDTGRFAISLGAANPLPLELVQAATRPGPDVHPNGILRIERTYVVVPELSGLVEAYARILNMQVPPLERGRVINADMAVFQVGRVGLGVATPIGPGPAAESLARRGPGPFQVLYRTRSMGAAVRWMLEHGLPEPARAIRNTGEQAILVSPERACGTYVALVGPE